jgi:hypothetical protein
MKAVPKSLAMLRKALGDELHHASMMQCEAVCSPWGPVKAKKGWRAGGFTVFAREYEDCAGGAVWRSRNLPRFWRLRIQELSRCESS